jgi:hypothetical protein
MRAGLPGGRQTVQEAFGPPLQPEEMTGNLTVLQNNLNREMKCPAGRNQVYIRSLLTGGGTTRPRIALKCSYRKDLKMAPEVFLADIREMCCGNPERCEAYRVFKERFEKL